MEIKYSPKAFNDLKSFDKKLQAYFLKHIDKLEKMPPRRHMKHGLPCHVENVTRQARLIYSEKKEILIIIRCFSTHKEYEKWYHQYN